MPNSWYTTLDCALLYATYLRTAGLSRLNRTQSIHLRNSYLSASLTRTFLVQILLTGLLDLAGGEYLDPYLGYASHGFDSVCPGKLVAENSVFILAATLLYTFKMIELEEAPIFPRFSNHLVRYSLPPACSSRLLMVVLRMQVSTTIQVPFSTSI